MVRGALVVFDEALGVVDRRAGESERFAVDFAAVFEEDAPRRVEDAGQPVLEAASGEARDGGVARFDADESGAVRDDGVSERPGEVLSVADGAGLRIARAAGREEDVLGFEREVLRRDEEAVRRVGVRLDPPHRAVRDDRHLLVPEKVAERMDDRRRLLVGGEDASVRHALRAHAERLEAAHDLARRTFADGFGDERRARAVRAAAVEVAEKLVGRDVLREVAASVGGHQHLRAEPRLALEDDARDAALGGDGGGEHAGGASSDDRELDGPAADWLGRCYHIRITVGGSMSAVLASTVSEGFDSLPSASNAVTRAR